jgi:large subunit ribosomal protein L1
MVEKKIAKKIVAKKKTVKKVEKPKEEEKPEITEETIKTDLKKSEKKQEAKKVEKKTESQPKASKKNKLKKSEKKHSKKYRQVAGLVESNKIYELEEAMGLIKRTLTTKFDASVDVHIRLNIDLANSEQQVRGSLVLPAGTGKTKKVCAIVGSDKEKEAKEAGADSVGSDDLIAKIEKGWLDFEVVVATPDMMPQLGKIGKILGTKGLMPNPKVGTVTNDIGKVVKSLKSGMVEYRTDKQGIVHLPIGRVSFLDADLMANFKELLETIHKVRPSGVKGIYIKNIYLTTTMGPSIRVSEK